MLPVAEQILFYLGVLILVMIGFGLGITGPIMLLVGIRALSSRMPSSHFFQALRKFVRQSILASIEFLLIVTIFTIPGAAVGEAIKQILYIESAFLNGIVFGLICGGLVAFCRVAPKWGHCYLGNHDYIGEAEYPDYDEYLIDTCKLCGKYLD